MKNVGLVLIIIVFISSACSKDYLPLDGGTIKDTSVLNNNLTQQQQEEFLNSIAKGVAKTFENDDYFNYYLNEKNYFKEHKKRLHIGNLFEKNPRFKEEVAGNMNVSIKQLDRNLNSLPRRIEISSPLQKDKPQNLDEFLVTYFTKDDDTDLSKGVTAYNRIGDKINIDIREKREDYMVILGWSRSRYLGGADTERIGKELESFNFGDKLLKKSTPIVPDLRPKLPPGTITYTIIDYIFLYSDGESVGDAEIVAWVTSNSLLYGDWYTDDGVKQVTQMQAINSDYTHYYTDYTICSFNEDEEENTYYLYIVEDDWDWRGIWYTTSVLADYFTITVESDYTTGVDDVILTIKHHHVYP